MKNKIHEENAKKKTLEFWLEKHIKILQNENMLMNINFFINFFLFINISGTKEIY